MQLEEILHRTPVLEIHGNTSREISELVFDSRKVVEDSMYIAIVGTLSNGHSFMDSAIKNGAKAILCEVFPEILNEEITYIKVKNSSKSLGVLAANFYGNPSEKLKLIGITGTNGKNFNFHTFI